MTIDGDCAEVRAKGCLDPSPALLQASGRFTARRFPRLRRTPTANTLFYGDNLHILRDYIEDESVDLVYLDPPFNSNATYNVLFRAPSGEQSQAQIEAFEDTWHWNEAAERASLRPLPSTR